MDFLYEQHADSTYIMGGEYLPLDTKLDFYFTAEVLTNDDQIIVDDYMTIDGDNIVTLSNMSNEKSAVILPIINYDNYQAYDQNHNEIAISSAEHYRMELEIPPNFKGSITVKYEPPFFWRIAELISLLTLILLIVFVNKKKKTKID